MPKFSVIVPVYNVEKYLKECIDSVLNQTYDNFELILVDDGSTDGCGKICDEYAKKDSRVKTVHKKNGGLVSARKTGVKACSGDYTLCLDGDDFLSLSCLEEISNIIEKFNPEIISFEFVKDKGLREEKINLRFKSGFYDKEKMQEEIYPFLIESKNGEYFSNCICGKVFKRELYSKFQLLVDDEIKIGEDCACTKPILFNGKSLFVSDKAFYFYRENENSMTKDRKPFNLLCPKIVAKHFESNMDISYKDIQDQIYRNCVHFLFNSCCTQFYKKQSYKDIKKEIKNILEDEYYKKAIQNCKYGKCFSGKLALFCLKHEFIFPMKIYSKIKRL